MCKWLLAVRKYFRSRWPLASIHGFELNPVHFGLKCGCSEPVLANGLAQQAEPAVRHVGASPGKRHIWSDVWRSQHPRLGVGGEGASVCPEGSGPFGGVLGGARGHREGRDLTQALTQALRKP